MLLFFFPTLHDLLYDSGGHFKTVFTSGGLFCDWDFPMLFLAQEKIKQNVFFFKKNYFYFIPPIFSILKKKKKKKKIIYE
jgi:hypothetical protein